MLFDLFHDCRYTTCIIEALCRPATCRTYIQKISCISVQLVKCITSDLNAKFMSDCRNMKQAAIGIVIADALLGEITPAMAAAVCQSGAKRVLIPVNHCDNYIVGVPEQPIGDLVTAAVQKVTDLCGGSSC